MPLLRDPTTDAKMFEHAENASPKNKALEDALLTIFYWSNTEAILKPLKFQKLQTNYHYAINQKVVEIHSARPFVSNCGRKQHFSQISIA